MMQVSLKDFIHSGAFGSIEVGMSREAVERVLGKPKNWEARAHSYLKADIWKYGDIEFYFQNGSLWMIFLDRLDAPNGGRQIELDAWIISGALTRAQAEQHLAEEAIAFREEPFPYNDNGVHLVTGSGTVLAFAGKDAHQPSLHSIHRCLKS